MSEQKISLADRREALLVACALQRVEVARELTAIRAPSSARKGVNLKVPLTIASVVLGMVATRSGKALPMLTAGVTLIKMASTVMSLVRGRE